MCNGGEKGPIQGQYRGRLGQVELSSAGLITVIIGRNTEDNNQNFHCYENLKS
jgi:hypothetical protein